MPKLVKEYALPAQNRIAEIMDITEKIAFQTCPMIILIMGRHQRSKPNSKAGNLYCHNYN